MKIYAIVGIEDNKITSKNSSWGSQRAIYQMKQMAKKRLDRLNTPRIKYKMVESEINWVDSEIVN